LAPTLLFEPLASASVLLPRVRDFSATPNVKQKQVTPRKGKGGSKAARARPKATEEDDGVEIEEDAAENVQPVHARRTRISMQEHLKAMAIAQEPQAAEIASDPLENIQGLVSRWNRKPDPAQLWAQYSRLVAEDGDVASLGTAEVNAILGIFSGGENVSKAVWEARAGVFSNVVEQMTSAGGLSTTRSLFDMRN
jgi:hypothetical protein